MNYRHAYHAGNHADVLKHVALARVIERLKAKEAPFRFFDAHAAIGLYDLAGEEAGKTNEWRDGVGRLFADDGSPVVLGEAAEPLIAPWRACVAAVNASVNGPLRHYPGSPEIARLLLRSGDRLRLNELHPVDCETLRARFRADGRTAVTGLDALLFVKSQTPPPERRGVVLIDPPYEKTNEADHALRMLTEGLRRFATGVFVLWYPITGDGLDEQLRAAACARAAKTLIAELRVRAVRHGGGLAGSGVIVINPPWRLDDDLNTLLPSLAERLSQGDAGFLLETNS